MVPAAQISYPSHTDDPDANEQPVDDLRACPQDPPDEGASEAPDELQSGSPDELKSGEEVFEEDDEDLDEGFEEDFDEDLDEDPYEPRDDEYIHRESGRAFSVSPEDFCAEPYTAGQTRETRQELGKRGEEAAVRYLQAKGYTIVQRNWFCRFGEADIIALSPDHTLCFIEVKTRRSIEAGFPEEAITPEKQRRYERIALCYMMLTDEWEDNEPVRFDAICICVTGPHRAMLRHHKGCFNGCV